MPSEYEFGCWKRHYIACVRTLDYVTANNAMYGMRGDGRDLMPKKSTKKELSLAESNKMLTSRQPWVGPDYHPKDLDKNMYAFLHDYNPNEPSMPKSALLFHNRWGILKKKSNVTTNPNMELGLTTQRRRERHRALTSGEDYDLLQTGRSMTLTESLQHDLVNPREQRVSELVNTGWFPPNRTGLRSSKDNTRNNLAGGRAPYQGTLQGTRRASLAGNERPQNPRVIFISSRVPAADLLLDAVLFGVIPIVYEYEGTTAESLCVQLEKVLQGRNAQSIGIFTHNESPGEIRLVHGCNVSIQNLDFPDAREFFEVASGHILPSEMGGQFDMFAPLAASELGMELMVQLTVLTGVQFSSPTGIIGSYNHVNTDWCIPYREGPPPEQYFCTSKLNVWANTADQAVESLKKCREILTSYFESSHRDIAAQLAGEVVFGVLGQVDIRGVKRITDTLSEGLYELGSQDGVNPLEFLGQYLLQKAGVSDLEFTSTRKRAPAIDQEEENEDDEGDDEDMTVKADARKPNENRDWDSDNDDIETGQGTRREEGVEKGALEGAEMKEEGTRKRAGGTQRQKVVLRTQELSRKFGTMRDTGKLERMTAQRYSDHPEKRTPIAMEIVSSEVEYNRLLTAIKNVYFKPLNAALRSNRAIISNQNLQIIFTDVLQILQHSHLQEMLLLPSQRINEYVTLLSWFELHTPKSHQDRADLEDTIETLTELDKCIREALLEANRYLIKQLDANQLNPPKKNSEIPELQVFQHAAVYGLFLFNDALVMTRRTSKHFPFSRAIEYNYKFEASVSLNRLRIHNLPDSKDLQNSVKLETAKQQWFFSCETPEEKINWIGLVEQSIRAALQGSVKEFIRYGHTM
ncbi:ECT2L-like protein [Mya arenaria]|uniref:ECT2L-like protein n=1 Tax=Mya arenaria TaxID=6604 RepID=A0ABY7EJD6_MYAAR|nr:ECT2L-like protein [Mya arenaria]